MPITDVSSNPETMTLTVVGDYPCTVERLWDAYADPRQLEKFWGPETWPATFTRHDMAVGGRSHYYMTGPEGEQSHGYWEFLAIDAPKRIEVRDGFADASGVPNSTMPSMRMVITFESTDAGSRFTNVTHFNSVETMEKLVSMGMIEGMKSAVASARRRPC